MKPLPVPCTLSVIVPVFNERATAGKALNALLAKEIPGVHIEVLVVESNRPPVLAPIADQIIHAQMTVRLTNSAADANVPAQILTFDLAPGAPAGAALDPTSGVLSWTPEDSQTGSHVLTVAVTDDGLPALTDAKSFTVTVEPRPTLQSVQLGETNATLVWTAIPGLTYRVQFKSSLEETAWTDLAPDVLAAGPTASFADPDSLDRQRFYRVQVVP